MRLSVVKKNASAIPSPKIAPLPGSLLLEWKSCGRENCRCQQGHLHGPYYSRHWREKGRRRKAYVRREDLAATLLGIELRRALIQPASRMIECVKASLMEARK